MGSLLSEYSRSFVASVRPYGRKPGRCLAVDGIRGLAVAMMLIYHVAWDLDEFSGVLSTGLPFWRAWQEAIVALFTLVFGFSLVLKGWRGGLSGRWGGRSSGSRGGSLGGGSQVAPSATSALRGFAVRAAVLLTWALIISLSTLITLGTDRFVRFGIIHLFGVATLLCYPLLGFRWLNLFLGLVVLGVGTVLEVLAIRPDVWWGEWLIPTGGQSVDSAPLFPVAGGILVGIFLGNLFLGDLALRRDIGVGLRARSRLRSAAAFPAALRRLEEIDRALLRLPCAVRWIPLGLVVLGQNSLLIYLIHQPILLSLLALMGIVVCGDNGGV